MVGADQGGTSCGEWLLLVGQLASPQNRLGGLIGVQWPEGRAMGSWLADPAHDCSVGGHWGWGRPWGGTAEGWPMSFTPY